MALDPLTSVLDLGKDLIDKIFPDPASKAEAYYKLEELKQSGELAKLQSVQAILTAQLEVAKVEAASQDKFVTRARPFIMWACGIGFVYAIIGRPILIALGADPLLLPTPDLTLAFKVLLGMLGIAG